MKRKLLATLMSVLMIFSMWMPIFAEDSLSDENADNSPKITENIEADRSDQIIESEIESNDNLFDTNVSSFDEPTENDEKIEMSDSTDGDSQSDSLTVLEGDNDEEVQTPDSTVNVVMTNNRDQTFNKSYSSLNEAIADTKEYYSGSDISKGTYTITLMNDMSEDVVIPAKRQIVIDLNGHTLSNVKDHTIINNSARNAVKITDSSDNQTGTVDNKTHGKAAIYNNINASITLEGGTYSRSQESSTSALDAGGNSWYVIKNYGTMYIKGSSVVKFSDTNPGYFSSLIGNGWYDSAKAESGANDEPKPSEGKNKSRLVIYNGTFLGGKITVKNDDYGNLEISGGEFKQSTENYYAVYNANVAEISGGKFESSNGSALRSDYFEGNANAGEMTITSGTFKAGGDVVEANGGNLVIEDGTFESESSEAYLIKLADTVNASISGGTFIGTKDKVSNKENIYKDGFTLHENADGSLFVGEDPDAMVASVVDIDGEETRYLTLKEALSNAPANSKVTLLKDATTSSTVSTNQFGITIDMNGFNIDGSEVKDGFAVLILKVKPSTKPLDGNNVITLTNSRPGGGEIKGDMPLEIDDGHNSYQLQVNISDNVILTSVSGKDPIVLSSSAYLVYSDKNASYFTNGTYKITDQNGIEKIYGEYTSAAKDAADGKVTLMHDYTGEDIIHSGTKDTILDLDGHTYTYTGQNGVIDFTYGVELTVKNGKIVSEGSGVDLYGAGNESGRSLILENVDMTVNGENAYGIVANGTEEDNKIQLTNSSLNVPNGFGIYFPSSGSVTVDNSTINAKYVGVQMCAGDLTVKGNNTSITVTNSPIDKTENDGVISDGAAISIIERDGYKDLGTITIEDGTFTSENSESVKTYSFNNTDKAEGDWEESKETVKITGGTYSDLSPIKNASEGADIDVILNNDVNLDDETSISIPENTNITIDLNGHNITSSEGSEPMIQVNGDLTVVNSGDEASADVKINVDKNGSLKYDPSVINDENIMDESDNTTIAVSAKVESSVDMLSVDTDTSEKIRSFVEKLVNDNESAGLVFYEDAAIDAIREAVETKDAIHIEILLSKDVKEADKNLVLTKYPTSEHFFEITIYVVIGNSKYAIKELPTDINVDIDVPDDMVVDGRELYIVRAHEGKVENIGMLKDVDGDGNLEFTSRLFSTYAIAYDEKTSVDPSPDRPSRPSSPSKDLPSNTEECQKEFGKDYIYSKDLDACIIKYLVVDTSTK